LPQKAGRTKGEKSLLEGFRKKKEGGGKRRPEKKKKKEYSKKGKKKDVPGRQKT